MFAIEWQRKVRNLFYWFYVGYGHRRKECISIAWLNKNENFIVKTVLARAYDLVLEILKIAKSNFRQEKSSCANRKN